MLGHALSLAAAACSAAPPPSGGPPCELRAFNSRKEAELAKPAIAQLAADSGYSDVDDDFVQERDAQAVAAGSPGRQSLRSSRGLSQSPGGAPGTRASPRCRGEQQCAGVCLHPQ